MIVTGSSIPLLRRCQWWARPEVIAPPAKPLTEAMELGNQVHALIEATIQAKRLPEDSSNEAMDLFAEWATWWSSTAMSAGKWQAEVAYAYDPHADKARCLGENMARRYEVEAHEVAGTIDAMLLEDDHAVVIDWKTGQDFAGLTADASDNWQLRLYALAVSRAHRVDTVKVMIVRITPHGVRTTEYTLDALELDAVAGEVSSLVRSAPTSQPTPGSHCRRCKVVAACPTTAAATTAIAPVEPVELAITSPEQATTALIRLRQVQSACEQMESLLKAYAEANGGIDLDNGKRWTKQSSERELISLNHADGALGIDAINSYGAGKALETKTTTSKAAVERELKAAGFKGKELRAKMDALMADLRAAGVVRTNQIDSWREV